MDAYMHGHQAHLDRGLILKPTKSSAWNHTYIGIGMSFSPPEILSSYIIKVCSLAATIPFCFPIGLVLLWNKVLFAVSTCALERVRKVHKKSHLVIIRQSV